MKQQLEEAVLQALVDMLAREACHQVRPVAVNPHTIYMHTMSPTKPFSFIRLLLKRRPTARCARGC